MMDLNSEMTLQDEMASISLPELAYLRRLQKYQKRKSDQIEQRLRRLEKSCEIRRRLTKCTSDLQHGLSEAIQLGNKKNFALLYHAFRTVEQASEEYDAQLSSLADPAHFSTGPVNENFLDQVLPGTRDVLLDFISRVAFDSEFLLDRLLCLSNSEFASLLKPFSQSFAEQSAFGNPSRKLHDGSDPEALRDFLDLSRHDVLSFLLQLVTKDSINDRINLQVGRTRAWGTVCAGLLSHQKPGSDKFVVAVLNAWLPPLEKSARNGLESWLLETLRDGDFLLDKPEKQSFRMRIQAREGLDTEDKEATERYFSKAIRRLLEVLKNSRLTGVIPAIALDLGRTIVAGLDSSPRQQQAAPYFLCTRWLFASYLATVIRNPESRGLCLSYHISSNARQRILNEVALRAQRLAFDVAYTWKHSASVEADLLADMEAVVNLFRPCQPERETAGSVADQDDAKAHVPLKYLTMCPSDLINLVHALCPEQRPSLFQSTSSLTGSTLRSSASSVSGMSLFRTSSPSGSSSFADGGLPNLVEDVSFQSMPGFQSVFIDSLSDTLSEPDGSYSILKLREACIELEISTEYEVETANRDPFSERWTTLQVFSSGHVKSPVGLQRSNAESFLGDSSIPVTNHGSMDTPKSLDITGCNLMKTGILTLLDEFMPILEEERAKSTDANILRDALIERFEYATSLYYQQGEFSKALAFFRITSNIRSLSCKLTLQTIVPMLHQLADNLQQSFDDSQAVVNLCEARSEQLNLVAERQTAEIRTMSRILDRLREKMWFVADVQSASQYEDLRRVGSALRVMGSSLHSTSEKSQPPLRHRGGSRPLSQDLQLKAEAATLELLSAPVGRGGPNKLCDVQVKTTLEWMQSHGIENLCKAEERLHRFCMQISRCVESLVGETLADNPILWSSELYQRQRPLSGSHFGANEFSQPEETVIRQLRSLYAPNASISYTPGSSSNNLWGKSPVQTQRTAHTVFPITSMDGKPSAQDPFRSRSPTLTNKSSASFWSTFGADAQSPSSATSLPSRTFSPMSSERPLSSHACDQASFLVELRQNLTGLLLSDFGHLFREGSETDRALRDPLNGKLVKTGLQDAQLGSQLNRVEETGLRMDAEQDAIDGSQCPRSCSAARRGDSKFGQNEVLPAFDFDGVFRTLLKKFEIQPSPYLKLDALFELQSMLETSGTAIEAQNTDIRPLVSTETNRNTMTQDRFQLRIDTSILPRASPGQDGVVLGFRRLFRNPELRPKTLFRDLQYVASLVPLRTLDSTARGRAFWNATIAALDLKQEIFQGMIETADQIVSYHTFNRGHSRVTSAAQAKRDSATFPPPSSSPGPCEKGYAGEVDVAHLSMLDAATLLQVTAKEGIPAAQRELATLYLTHPDLLGISIAPFSRPRDVFKDSPGVTASTSRKDRDKIDRDRYDPVAMAMAQHWMELSAKGGDGPATKYLRAKDEFERIP